MQVNARFLRVIVLLGILGFVVSCKKKDDAASQNDEPKEVVYAQANVNNAVHQYLRYKYFLVQIGNTYENNLILSRGSQEKIQLIFRGTEEGIYKLSPSDSTIKIRYYDAAGRMFKADSGSISINELTFRNGSYTISGGFAFNAYYKAQFADTSYIVKAAVRDGGFIPLINN